MIKDALQAYYDGEIQGEAVYAALLEGAVGAEERLKLATLLQLETETRAWLRPAMLAYGVDMKDHSVSRQSGVEFAEQLASLAWPQKMQALKDAIESQLLPGFQAFVEAAEASGDIQALMVCRYMFEHEKAQAEFAERELMGDETALEPITRFLRYPLRK
jgi:hypothetical protein